MVFCDVLNRYISQLGCTARELAAASGLSATAISRYRSGEREPHRQGAEIEKLARGIAALSRSRGEAALAYDAVLQALRASLGHSGDPDTVVEHFNALIALLEVNLTRLAKAINYDSSYLYRIRTGQRRPSDPAAFSGNVCRYIVAEYHFPAQKAAVAGLLGCEVTELETKQDYYLRLEQWLTNGSTHTANHMESFLKHLNAFDLNEYIRAIRFDELKPFSLPFQLPMSRNYYGTEQMKQGELAFFKQTVLSKSMEPIFMCSDMPMADMAEDLDFGKKWMFAIAMTLKKGLRLNIIHHVDRPFHEMMMGLESWIPIYMTGQVSPFHLKGVCANYYHHLTYVSGSAALDGQCIDGSHGDGKYYFTNNQAEVAYYRRRADALLAKATVLMEIFTMPEEQQFRSFAAALAREHGSRKNILPAPPLYTISAELLERILRRSDLSPEEENRIRSAYRFQRDRMPEVLEHSTVEDEICAYTPEEFEKEPVCLSVSYAFSEVEIPYTYEEYLEHLRLTEEFAACHPGYTVSTAHYQPFRNIQIQIVEDSLVMISKNKAPAIHFVIRHPKMVAALQNFVPAFVREE